MVLRIGRNHSLGRLLAAYLLNVLTEYGQWMAVLVFAYERGGATLAGTAAIAQLVPAIVLAPLITAHGAGRIGVVRLLVGAYVTQTAALACLAVTIMIGSPTVLVFAAAALMSVALSVSRSMHTVLMPLVVRRPDELTAANAATSWVDALGAVMGPLLVGVLIGIGGVGVACAALAGVAAPMAALAAIAGIKTDVDTETSDAGGIGNLLVAARAIGSNPPLRALIAFPAGAAVIEGAADLLVVILAVSVLKTGSGSAGYLAAAVGLGGIAGAALALFLVGRKLALPLALAAVLGSAALAALAFVSTAGLAVLLLVIVGASRAVQGVSAQTLLQRSTSLDLIACVFALIEELRDCGLAASAIAVPILVRLGGPEAAFIGLALPAPFVVLVTARRLLNCDRLASNRIVETGLLRNVDIFAGLSQASLELLASQAEYEAAPSGREIIRQGDIGDRYYVIADGGVDVSQNGVMIRHQSQSQGFGEIALLHDSPRTASVTASEDTSLLSIEREAFLTAMHSATAVHAAVTRVAQERNARAVAD